MGLMLAGLAQQPASAGPGGDLHDRLNMSLLTVLQDHKVTPI